MQAEIASLQAAKVQAGPSAPDVKIDEPFEIPPQLTATLSILRDHVAELTRDNDALRNTFLPRHRAAVKKGIVPSSGVLQGEVVMDDITSEAKRSAVNQTEEVDLEAVVQYVKDLIRENEELGAMVMEAGKTDQAEWQAALDGATVFTDPETWLTVLESRAVIESLE